MGKPGRLPCRCRRPWLQRDRHCIFDRRQVQAHALGRDVVNRVPSPRNIGLAPPHDGNVEAQRAHRSQRLIANLVRRHQPQDTVRCRAIHDLLFESPILPPRCFDESFDGLACRPGLADSHANHQRRMLSRLRSPRCSPPGPHSIFPRSPCSRAG
jgi:hypothetical protein